MVSTKGLTSVDFKTFDDLIIKANRLQLVAMQSQIGAEMRRRKK